MTNLISDNEQINPHDFLIYELGAKEVPHGSSSLYDHLSRVEQILRIVRVPDYVCLAGLYHSIYGTKFFKHKTVSDRDIIKNIIGEKAERLVHIFCNADRPYCWNCGLNIPFMNGTSVRIDPMTHHHLSMIEGANLLDQKTGIKEIISFTSKNVDFDNWSDY